MFYGPLIVTIIFLLSSACSSSDVTVTVDGSRSGVDIEDEVKGLSAMRIDLRRGIYFSKYYGRGEGGGDNWEIFFEK